MQERELITFLFGTGVLVYLMTQHRKLPVLAELRLPFLAYASLVCGWLASLLDNSFAVPFFTILEHGFFTLAVILLFGWLRGLETKRQ